MDDRELLREYVERQSEAAFAELVARHVDLVYATARRVVGDAQAAQDVAQAVFIHLARKAWTVRDGRTLRGWLYRAAYRTALDDIRGEQRRRRREVEAMNLAEQNTGGEASWEKLAPLLDEAMLQLNRGEQNAVLARYFEGKTMREAGEALGTTEAAAQMRVTRALEKMRTHFARSGVTVTGVALATILSTRPSEAAPRGFAERVAGHSLAGASGEGAGYIASRILFMSTKTKFVAVIIVLLLIIVIVAIKLSHRGATASTPILASNRIVAQSALISTATKPRTVELPVVAVVPAKGGIGDLAVVTSSANQAIPTPGVSPDEQAKINTAKIFVNSEVDSALLGFKNTMGRYPTTDEGFGPLLKDPGTGEHWRGPFFHSPDSILDPWGNPYRYAYPSTHSTNRNPYDCWSTGPSGINGAADNIVNW